MSCVKRSVVGELPLIDEDLLLRPIFFPFFVEFCAPNFHFTIFVGLQVTIELAVKIYCLLGSTNPPFSHSKEEESDNGCMSVEKLTVV